MFVRSRSYQYHYEYPGSSANAAKSKSYADNRTEMEVYNRKPGADLRSYSTSTYPSGYQYHYEHTGSSAQRDYSDYSQPRKEKSSKWFSDPEFQRKRRVARYKTVGYQRKFKGSLKKGIKWIKNRCMQVVYGWH